MAQSNGYNENVIPLSTNEKVNQQGLVHTQNENALGSNNSPHMENRFLYFSNLNNDDDNDDAYKRDNLKLKEFSKCPPPLGLKLTITSSLMQSIEEKLNGVAETVTPWQPSPAAKKDEKLKAVHFPMQLLRFGLFKIEAKYASHLVAKCYYAKRKLVWEILRNGLKEKIEIQWQNILAIRAVIAENKPGILEIELATAPSFFRETEPKPGKHTRWDICGDFTAGQASKYRRHYLQFHPGVLDQHYVKLLQCDNRLLELSKGPFPSLQSPYFDSHLDHGTTHFSIGHVLHVHGSKITSGSEQEAILKLPKVPTQQVQLFGNRMPLSPIAINDPTTPTSDICSPTNEDIVNNQMLQETTLFLPGHDLHVHGSKTTWGSEQQLICQQPVVPTQQVHQFGNMMPLSLIANDPTSPTLDICSPTNEAIINNQMLQETTLFPSSHDLHVHGSKTTSASEQQLICQQPAVPTQQVQQFGNMMPLSLIADDPSSDICSPANEAINNQMLQDPNLAAWSEALYYETLFPMESVPCASNLQRNGPVPNYELPNNNNNMLLTGYSIPETVFDRRHMGNIVKLVNANAIAGLSMEAGPAYNTNTSTQIYQPNTSENSWNALDGSVQQQYYASNANLNPMHGNPFVDPRLFTT